MPLRARLAAGLGAVSVLCGMMARRNRTPRTRRDRNARFMTPCTRCTRCRVASAVSSCACTATTAALRALRTSSRVGAGAPPPAESGTRPQRVDRRAGAGARGAACGGSCTLSSTISCRNSSSPTSAARYRSRSTHRHRDAAVVPVYASPSSPALSPPAPLPRTLDSHLTAAVRTRRCDTDAWTLPDVPARDLARARTAAMLSIVPMHPGGQGQAVKAAARAGWFYFV